jgi:hypothetical protein
VGAHGRVKDGPVRHVPALAMLAWSAIAARSYPTQSLSST